jgi:transcriptional regulator of nitric oxide reductase
MTMFPRKQAGITQVAALIMGVAVMAALPADARGDDYPTEARVDYVLGCMAANGQSRLVMRKCSCSIDYIAEHMSYDDYVGVETVKRLRLQGGERTSIFRDSEAANTLVDEFRRLQVQADLECF